MKQRITIIAGVSTSGKQTVQHETVLYANYEVKFPAEAFGKDYEDKIIKMINETIGLNYLIEGFGRFYVQ